MSAPPPPTAPPPPAASPPTGDPSAGDGPLPPRRLTRRRSGRLIGGVAAGLASYLGVDPIVTRLGFVLLAFLPFPGFGVLIYLGMLLLVPQEAEDGVVPPVGPVDRTPAFWLGVGLVALASFALLGVSSATRFDALVPLLLIGLGVALWVDADRRPAREDADRGAGATATGAPPVWATSAPDASSPGPSPSTGAAASDTWGASGAGSGGVGGPPSVPPAPTRPAWTPPPVRRPSSPLGRITLGLALLAGGVAWMIDLLGLARVPVESMFAVTLLVLGGGLLLGSVVGRARWLAAVAALVLPLTLAAAVIGDLGIDLRDGVASRLVVVNDTSELARPIALGAGELTIDLTQAPLTDGLVLEAQVGVGELVVLVPEGTGVEGQVRVEVGESELLGENVGGVSVRRDLRAAADEGQPTVVLDLRVGAGRVVVERYVDLDEDVFDEDVFDEDVFDEDVFDDDAATEEVQP
jgi:phage shock protein PspC (stress-responsive transcriptional regulator)